MNSATHCVIILSLFISCIQGKTPYKDRYNTPIKDQRVLNALTAEMLVGGHPACGGKPITTAWGAYKNDSYLSAPILQEGAEILSAYSQYLIYRYTSAKSSQINFSIIETKNTGEYSSEPTCVKNEGRFYLDKCNGFSLEENVFTLKNLDEGKVYSYNVFPNILHYFIMSSGSYNCLSVFKLKSVNL